MKFLPEKEARTAVYIFADSNRVIQSFQNAPNTVLIIFIFILAPCISKIHLVSHTNKCTSISYINLKQFSLKHLH